MINIKKSLKMLLNVITLLFVFSQKSNAISDIQETRDSLYVTYIGAAGFLFETGSQKVMIDAVLTRTGANGFILPSVETINNINTNNEPFGNIDLYLVGHAHADHFDPGMMDNCMQNNASAKLVCPQETVDKIKALAGNHYETYKNRIIVPKLNNYQSLDTIISNIGIQVTLFPPFSYHTNGVMVFSVIMNNIKTFHLMGTLLSESAYSTYEFNNQDNDILLVTSNYL